MTLHLVPDPDPSIAAIIEAVAQEFGLTPRLILSDRRQRTLVEARHVAMWLAKELTTHSYPTIGRAFHRDHSTVMYGCDRIEERFGNEPDLHRRLTALAGLIGRNTAWVATDAPWPERRHA